MNRQFFIGFFLMALVAIAVIFWLLRKHGSQVDGLNSIIEADKGIITYHVNNEREAIAETRQARASLNEYKASHPEEIAAILKQFGIKESQLESYLKASFTAKDKGVSVTHTIFVPDSTTTDPKDSIQQTSFEINDGYLNLKGATKVEDWMPWLSVNWEYTYTDTLSFVGRKSKRTLKNLFAKQTYWVDGKINNPKAQINSLRNVQITEFSDKRFSVGPAVLFDPFSGTFRAGISVQYALIKF